MKTESADAAAPSPRNCALKQRELIAARHRRCERSIHEEFFFAGPAATQDQDRPLDAGVAELYALGHTRNTQPICSRLGKGLGNRHSSVAVGIRLHNRQDLAWFFAGKTVRIDELSHRGKIALHRA